MYLTNETNSSTKKTFELLKININLGIIAIIPALKIANLRPA